MKIHKDNDIGLDAYIVDAVFTPRASVKKQRSVYSDLHPQQLLATCIDALIDRNMLQNPGRHPDYLIAGCVSQANDHGANIARNAVLLSGLELDVPAASLDMCCGSGLESINMAVARVASGIDQLTLAGGVESMSRVKIGADGGGMDGGSEPLRRKWLQMPQGASADYLAHKHGIKRNELDQFGLHSQLKAASCITDDGDCFDPVHALVELDGQVLLKADNHVRPNADLAAMAALHPAFQVYKTDFFDYPESVHTAGTSSGIADGAGLALVASAAGMRRAGLIPRARVLGVQSLGSNPLSMLDGVADCCRLLLQKLDLEVDDIDLWEINEAFAVVPLIAQRSLGIDPARLNIAGGAISRGHPLGATGAILVASMLALLEREQKRLGCIVLCVAGGQSVAMILERTVYNRREGASLKLKGRARNVGRKSNKADIA